MKQPTCSWVQDHFATYRKGVLPAPEADAVFSHLMTCGGCRTLLWEPESEKFRTSLSGGAWLVDRAVQERASRFGRIPLALAASEVAGGRVGHARGLALLGDSRERRVDVYCQAQLVAGTPGSIQVQLPSALKLSGVREPWKPVVDALHQFVSNDLPALSVEVALDGPGPLPPHLMLSGDSLHLPVAMAAASVWLDLPIRRDRIFTGALRSDGLLLEVGDIDEKLYLLPLGSRLVVPRRAKVASPWHNRALLAADVGEALDHASAVVPEGGMLSLMMPGISGEVAAIRATVERLPGMAFALALADGNPTGAPLWLVGGRTGLVALIPSPTGDGGFASAAVRQVAEQLRRTGVLSRERVPFPLRGLDLAPAGVAARAGVLPESTWIDPRRLAEALSTSTRGRAYLPWATATEVARALWAWGGGEATSFEQALPAEPAPQVSEPGLSVGKIRSILRPGGRMEVTAGSSRWCDPDLRIPFADLTRHLFLAGNGSAQNVARLIAEGSARARIPTVVLDLAGGMASMAIPATEAGLKAVGARIPGAEVRLKPRVEGLHPWPGETPEVVAPVPARVTFAGGASQAGMPPREPPPPGLWVIDAHHRGTEARLNLLMSWCQSLSRIPSQTVSPGRPRITLVVCLGSLLSVGGAAVAAVEQLLRVGHQVGVGVVLLSRTPGDLHPSLVALCQGGMIASPGASGGWPTLPPGWTDWAPALSNLGAEDLLYRTAGQVAVIQARLPASLPLPEVPPDLLATFARQVEGEAAPHGPMTTVLPDAEEEAEWLLEEVGVLLPRVPFQKQVLGYRIALGAGGEVGGEPSRVLAQLVSQREVAHGYQVSLDVLEAGVSLDGRNLTPGSRVVLEHHHHVAVAGHGLEFSRFTQTAFPYVGEVSLSGGRRWPVSGQGTRIGRDRGRCDVWLPDRQSQADLLWVDGGPPAGAEGLALDAIHASGLHGGVSLDQNGGIITNISTRSPLFHRRGTQLSTLSPGEPGIALSPGDEILVGQRTFRWVRG